MVWLQYAAIAIPMALVWVMLTNQVSLFSYGLGFVLSFTIVAVLSRASDGPPRLNLARLPLQIIALLVYTLVLTRDILLSGIDVALRITGVRPLRPGIIAVKTQDPAKDPAVAGISAHGITITPGELVVDFDNQQTMYVHCLDAEEAVKKLDDDQAMRLKMIRRILGYD